MADSLHHPHDGLVKHMLGKPDNAAALARPLVEAVAPTLAARAPGARVLQVVLKLVPGILSEGETVADDVQTLVDDIGPEAKETYMSTASQLRAQGRAEGRVEVLMQLMPRSSGRSQLGSWTRCARRVRISSTRGPVGCCRPTPSTISVSPEGAPAHRGKSTRTTWGR
ncbi:hypothetical protein [Nocardia sp. AG03]|uniref:hypothetical protein n=1 Tax=Nocardia sp. AG03 TaxID=3025312 RepID=UPI00241881AE|nr:hypothetical protein [Nocardia sp. AG03]